jgi:hypothetical protein
MNPTLSGSPIFARQNANLFLIIGIVLSIFFVLFILYLIVRVLHERKRSPDYIEKQKSKPTTFSNVTVIARQANLLKEERDLLWKICKKSDIPNIIYLIRNQQEFEQLLKARYALLETENDEEEKACLFNLRSKIIATYNQPIIISQSKNIESSTIFIYTAAEGFHYKLPLIENNPDGLLLLIPDALTENNDKPAALSKIQLIFTAKCGVSYRMETRIVRYQLGKDNRNLMLVVHTDRLEQLQRRQTERVEIQKQCIFSSVNVHSGSSEKMTKVIYQPAEKKHEGVLEDISAGGCRIITSLPIRQDQYIYVEGPFNGSVTDSAIGIIVRTTKRRDEQYVLHIRFIKIEKAVINRIHAHVYKYAVSD